MWISFIRLDSLFKITWVDVVSRLSHFLFIIIEKDKKAISCVIEKIEATEKVFGCVPINHSMSGFCFRSFWDVQGYNKRTFTCLWTYWIHKLKHHTHTYKHTYQQTTSNPHKTVFWDNNRYDGMSHIFLVASSRFKFTDFKMNFNKKDIIRSLWHIIY